MLTLTRVTLGAVVLLVLAPSLSAQTVEIEKAEAQLESDLVRNAKSNPACTSPEDRQYLQKLLGIVDRLNDARSLAEATPRGNLAGPVASLQSVAREISGLTAPRCAMTLTLAAGFDAKIEVDRFLWFMTGHDGDIGRRSRFAMAWNAVYPPVARPATPTPVPGGGTIIMKGKKVKVGNQ